MRARKHTTCRWLGLSVASICVLVGPFAAAIHAATEDANQPSDPPATPREMVTSLHDALIASMKAGEKVGFQKRYNQLAPTINAAFDMDLVARLVLGAHWSSLEPDQQKQFTQTLRRFTIANYASRFDKYSGQSFTIQSVKEQRPNLQVVRATLTVNPEKKHQFDYQLRESDNRWRIVNVAVDGVSDLAMKRAQYVDVIERDGFAALIDQLNDRIDKMSQDEADDD